VNRLGRTAIALITVLALAACASAVPSELVSSSAIASASPTLEPTTPPSATPEPTGTLVPTATPSPADVPVYAPGSLVQTHIGGLRVRARPGIDERVVTGLLPDGADLLVALGPVLVDGYGWYLVNDSDSAEPEFTEGWVAAGFNPDPYLVPTVFELDVNPYVGGSAHDGDAEFGPVRITDASYQIRWIAAPPTIDGCSFAVDLAAGAGSPVPAIRATIGAVVAPGILNADYFGDHPELTGDIFVTVVSDCSWALTFVRLDG
jgi:hypothetical protein